MCGELRIFSSILFLRELFYMGVDVSVADVLYVTAYMQIFITFVSEFNFVIR